MRRDKMNAIAAEVYEAQKVIFETKGKEYTEGKDDALYNFKQVAGTYGVKPHLVCSVYLEKHLAAIRYAMEHPVLSEPLFGRIVDACNYLLLLYGLWLEGAQVEEEQSEREWQLFVGDATDDAGRAELLEQVEALEVEWAKHHGEKMPGAMKTYIFTGEKPERDPGLALHRHQGPYPLPCAACPFAKGAEGGQAGPAPVSQRVFQNSDREV